MLRRQWRRQIWLLEAQALHLPPGDHLLLLLLLLRALLSALDGCQRLLSPKRHGSRGRTARGVGVEHLLEQLPS